MRYSYILLLAALGLVRTASAQTVAASINFIEYQRSFPRMNDALRHKQDTLMKQFEEKRLTWPAKYIYLRSFKYDSQLEVWVKQDLNENFKLFKTYRVCAMAGSLGPKRMQGDYQVPEGFYYINEFNPKSQYHLSLGLNYPNASDKILSDSLMPGGDIYIHGSCVTTGCIPVNNEQIEELYILAAHARSEGQDFIPVHIFPIRFDNPRSSEYLRKYIKDFPEYKMMADELKHAYTYFEKTRKLPVIMVSKKGDYVVDGIIPKEKEVVVVKKERRPLKTYNQAEIATVVERLPVFPGGNEKFQAFIDNLGKEMAAYLGENQAKTFAMVEFVIDKQGKVIYANVIKGGNDDLNDKLIEAFENMPQWTPAVKHEQTVSVKLKQTIFIEKPETQVISRQ
ncbi:L,D-transpeptidase family protein [Longitalea luteola]|uniref:L,D-transpeptidase family protein n=1 Tax=Longitalea luteola TaxID=2812563 RepID=UPI001A9596E5|nr:L,D-transpeptidase family protein [Longitalea luteola]